KENDWLYYRICRQCGGSDITCKYDSEDETWKKVIQKKGFLLHKREVSVVLPEPSCNNCSHLGSDGDGPGCWTLLFYGGASGAVLLSLALFFRFLFLVILALIGVGIFVLIVRYIASTAVGPFRPRNEKNKEGKFNPVAVYFYNLKWYCSDIWDDNDGDGTSFWFSLNKKLTDSEVDALAAQYRQEAIDIFSDYMLWSESQAFFVKGEARREKD
ncbi:MAG: hypothetical protein MPJ24_10835, partial [Pirellulaceae bacterium]|nr:hypothetical protein [Pirellulaceae bacterium]